MWTQSINLGVSHTVTLFLAFIVSHRFLPRLFTSMALGGRNAKKKKKKKEKKNENHSESSHVEHILSLIHI